MIKSYLNHITNHTYISSLYYLNPKNLLKTITSKKMCLPSVTIRPGRLTARPPRLTAPTERPDTDLQPPQLGEHFAR
jgi:hypothetical protein